MRTSSRSAESSRKNGGCGSTTCRGRSWVKRWRPLPTTPIPIASRSSAGWRTSTTSRSRTARASSARTTRRTTPCSAWPAISIRWPRPTAIRTGVQRHPPASSPAPVLESEDPADRRAADHGRAHRRSSRRWPLAITSWRAGIRTSSRTTSSRAFSARRELAPLPRPRLREGSGLGHRGLARRERAPGPLEPVGRRGPGEDP